MPQEKTTTQPREKDEDALLTQYKNELSMDADIVEEQREEANEDMIFIHRPGGMWDGFFEDDLPSSSERIKMQFDLTSDPRDRFIGSWNTNRVSVEYKPDDSKTSEKDADLLNGIYRTDFKQFSGKLSTDNAVNEVADCGYGAYKIATKFEDMEDPENENQRIEFRPIHNAYNSVFWDANAKRIDKMDAMRCTELTQFTKISFEAIYPGKTAVSAFTPTNTGFQRTLRNRPEEIFIATRYTVVREKSKVFVYNNLESDEVEVFSEEEQHYQLNLNPDS